MMFDLKILDYDNSILSLSNSLLKHYGVATKYPSLKCLDGFLEKKYTNIVFMILDCMGSEIVAKNLSTDSFLLKHKVADISTVFPPTTTVATTTFHSGLPPLEHGWIGWMVYFKEHNNIIEIFRNKDYYKQEKLSTFPVDEGFLAYESIYSQIVEANRDVEYCKIFPEFDPDGVKSFKEMCDRIKLVTHKNDHRKIISAYWNEPDHSIHKNGTKGNMIKEILREIDETLQDLYISMDDTLVIISADHGAVDVEEIYLNDFPDLEDCLVILPSIEARFVTFFIKPEKKDFFGRRFREHFGEDFLLFTKSEFLSQNFLGYGEPHRKINDFIGDFVAISVSTKSLRYKSQDGFDFPKMLGDHAGFTKSEMMVPLIILEKA